MILLIDRHSGTPVFRQLVDQVRFQIATGVLGAGDELPSTRALATEHGLNPMTVSKAFTELERLGVVQGRPGRSHVVAPRAAQDAGADRTAALRRALEPGARAARQLGLGSERALEVFEALLREHDETQKDA